ncbi:hypothetical protein B0H21DRAFT_767048 [Amylocystis lapponica]|nr:hypothetical protein B0H21DRAFT_767048 [Amylocystis lapponica]
MSLLHAYFNVRNQRAFQRLLDGSNRGHSTAAHGLSTSGGKSWTKSNPLTFGPPCDVNARDSMGRTVLHLAAAAQDSAATEYVRLLLAHPAIIVNLLDKESHWTALHRALYHGNLATATLLLQRADIDTSLKDIEGYTAFDLYNSTLEGTKPSSDDLSGADLFTWGANRNAALGVGNGDDRAYPELVIIRPTDAADISEKDTLDARFSPVHVRQIAMSKLHTAVVTTESRNNLRVCGFGSGGRLGPGQHTQYTFVPLPQFTQTVQSVALGQDHTLALTTSGEVFSWGLNRFSQLGYVVEPPAGASILGRLEEPIQATARKVGGPLKNKVVRGVAACKTASACWTGEEVFTWGTNNGQLGYNKSAHPVQVSPRVVTKVSQPVIAVTITDSALACLLITQDVVCVWNDGHFKVNFPAHAFPSEIAVYRPPHANNNASIQKITSCDNTFAALTHNGELFTFSVSAPSEGGGGSSKSRTTIVPQRVWALRKQFSAVKDVALGSDGSIIICTESGHVFVRSRNLKAGQTASAKTFKFQKVPYLQRVVSVCANETGAYGALRVDSKPEPIRAFGKTLAQDIEDIQPYLRVPSRALEESSSAGFPGTSPPNHIGSVANASLPDFESDDEAEDGHIQKDIRQALLLCTLLERDREARKRTHGCGVQSSFEFPAHRIILSARCTALEQILAGSRTVQDKETNIVIKVISSKNVSRPNLSNIVFTGCQPLSVLILVAYLYTDEVLAVWDRRIGCAVEHKLAALKIKPAQIKTELQFLARVLQLQLFGQAVEPQAKRTPIPSMVSCMSRLFDANQNVNSTPASTKSMSCVRHPLRPDVILQLDDRDVFCHSAILRARSPFFAAFFDDEDWTVKRWSPEGTVTVNLKHLKWRVMEYVMRFLCCGGDSEMFESIDHIRTVDELMDFVFDVMAAANELLLDHLMLLCSEVILKRTNINNVSSSLTDAAYLSAMPLVESLHGYMSADMETMLESRMLDDLTPDLIRQLASFICQEQLRKYPVSRSSQLIDKAMRRYGDWLAIQDIPQPLIPTHRTGLLRDSPRLSPPWPSRTDQQPSQLVSPAASPVIRPQITAPISVASPPDDGVFVMDDPDITPLPMQAAPSHTASVEPASKAVGSWKPISSAPRVDMRAIMAEAQTTKAPQQIPIPASVSRKPSGDLDFKAIRATPHGSSRTVVPVAKVPERANVFMQGSVPASDPAWRLPHIPTTTTPPSPSGMPVGVSRPNGAPTGASTGPPSHSPHLQGKPSPRKAAGSAGLGPVFTPSKQSVPEKGASPSVRQVSNGRAWTLPPVQPVVQSSSSSTAMSFVAIQQLQQEQDVGATKDKRSLREIQREERERQVEEDFLRWWAAEEDRLKVEQEQTAAVRTTDRPPKARKAKGPKARPTTSTGQKQRPKPGKEDAYKSGRAVTSGTVPNPASQT